MSRFDFPPVPAGMRNDRLHDVANRLNSSTIHFTRYLRSLRHSDDLTIDRRSLLSLLVFGGPQRMSEISRRELISLPAASRMVSSLQELGLVERQSDPSDGRAVIVSATDAGQNLMDVARSERVGALAGRLQRLSSDDLELLGLAADIMNRLAIDDTGQGYA
jgi:DNA-binding MarR family transcriptional regulator